MKNNNLLAPPPPEAKTQCRQGFSRFAFTLAETLITLAIIGIIAAMTIPTLIANYQDKVMETSLKKAYNNIKHTMTMMQFDYGEDFLMERYPAESFAQDFGSHIKAEIISDSTYTHTGIKNPANGHFNCEDRLGDGYVKDANFLYMFRKAYAASHNFVYIFVDLNGSKGPNRIGFDVFPFVFTVNTFSATNNVMASNCISVSDITKKGPSQCQCDFTNDNVYNTGQGCTAIALNDPEYWKYIKKFK